MTCFGKTFWFIQPESFDPAEFLHWPKLRDLADDARYFVSLIHMKLARRDIEVDGHTCLMAKYLRNVMHKHYYAAVIEALLDGGAVTRTPYVVGQKAFGYMLADRFRNDKHVRVAATCPRLIRRLEAFQERAEAERRGRMLPVHFALERQQWRLRIDSRQAREIIGGLAPESNRFDVQGVLVAAIEQCEYHVNVGRYGRLTNNVTSMKREVREALRVDGHRLAHVDITNCQPALLGRTARQQMSKRNRGGQKQGNTNNRRRGETGEQGTAEDGSIYDAPNDPRHTRDLSRFCELVQRGTFYEFLLEQLRFGTCRNMTREELKRRFLADVLAKRKVNARGAEYPSAVEDCFAEHFPTIYRFIRAVNLDGWEHANMIRLLQREESKLVIETVAADLLTRHPRLFVLTLHDAIYTTPRSIPLVVCAFDEAFRRTGFGMTLKVLA
jgi:hypothetical protein